MKKAFVGIVLVVVCLIGGLWVVAFGTHRALDGRQWPDKLGTLADVPSHFPDVETNPAAQGLTQLTPPLGISVTPKIEGVQQPKVSDDWDKIKEPVGNYIRAELEKSNEQIASPPIEMAAYLNAHREQIDRVRDHILNAGPIVWVTHAKMAAEAPLPNLLGHMSLAKLLTARALMKATAKDATAWDDLHAVWLLDRELWQRPELISQLIALAGARMVNAGAAKMPLPPPSWLADMQTLDYRRHFMASQQAEAWSIPLSWKREMNTSKAVNLLLGGYFDAASSRAAETMRTAAVTVAETSNCDLSTISPLKPAPWNMVERLALPNIFAAWQRLYRFRVELESTQNALAIRQGQPASTTSKCADGTWAVTPSSAAFSHEIAVPSPGVKYPLAYRR